MDWLFTLIPQLCLLVKFHGLNHKCITALTNAEHPPFLITYGLTAQWFRCYSSLILHGNNKHVVLSYFLNQYCSKEIKKKKKWTHYNLNLNRPLFSFCRAVLLSDNEIKAAGFLSWLNKCHTQLIGSLQRQNFKFISKVILTCFFPSPYFGEYPSLTSGHEKESSKCNDKYS